MNARTSVAMRLIRAHRPEAARPYMDAALATMRAVGGPKDVHAADEMATYAINSFNVGAMPFAEARRIIEESLATMRSEPWPVPASLISKNEFFLAEIHLAWGDVRRGYELTSAAVATARSSWAEDEDFAQSELAAAAAMAGRDAEAEQLAADNLSRARRSATGMALEEDYELMATVRMQARRYEEADRLLAEFDGLPGVAQAEAERRAAQRLPSLTRLVVRLERGDARSVLAWTRPLESNADANAFTLERLARASAQCALGQTGEAIASFDKALARLAQQQADASPALAYWRARMGLCALQAGQIPRAREASTLASAAIARQPEVSAHLKAPVLELARRVAESARAQRA
jgi:hypothetical protein